MSPFDVLQWLGTWRLGRKNFAGVVPTGIPMPSWPADELVSVADHSRQTAWHLIANAMHPLLPLACLKSVHGVSATKTADQNAGIQRWPSSSISQLPQKESIKHSTNAQTRPYPSSSCPPDRTPEPHQTVDLARHAQ